MLRGTQIDHEASELIAVRDIFVASVNQLTAKGLCIRQSALTRLLE